MQSVSVFDSRIVLLLFCCDVLLVAEAFFTVLTTLSVVFALLLLFIVSMIVRGDAGVAVTFVALITFGSLSFDDIRVVVVVVVVTV